MIAISSFIRRNPKTKRLREFLLKHNSSVSIISVVEVLGYSKLLPQDKLSFEAFFAQTPILSITDREVQIAVQFRQKRNMSLGDSLIGATAIAHELPLATNNTKDFKWIDSLTLINPFVDN